MIGSNLRIPAFATIAMVAIDAVKLPLIMAWVVIDPDSYAILLAPSADSIDIGLVAFRILTMIVFAAWMYVAGRNLERAGYGDLDYSAGSRIGVFFVPVANLFLPYVGMRELWNASRGHTDRDANNALLAGWWALWLVVLVTGVIARFGRNDPDLAGIGALVRSVIDIPLGGLAIALVLGITRGQQALPPAEAEEADEAVA